MVEWKKLADLCEVKGRIGFRGYTREDQVEKGDGALSLSPGNIVDDVLDYNSCTYITWDKYEESPEIMVSEGDIILCKTASVGKVARIHELPQKATINPQLVLLKNIKINPQYLFYVLADAPFQSRIKRLAGVGSVPNVSQAKLSSIELPIPSLSEQQRIVGILDTFTASIDNLKAQIVQRRKQYEFYRDQLLDLEGKEGVEMKTLGDVCYISDYVSNGSFASLRENVTYKTQPDYAVLVRFADYSSYFDATKFVYIDKHAYEFLSKSILYGGEIIMSNVGSCGLYFKCPDLKMPMSLAPNSIVIKSQYIDYLFHWFGSFKAKEAIRSITSKSAMPKFNKTEFKKIAFPLPSLQDQHRIVSILDTFEASIQNLEAQLKQREKQYEYYRNKLLTFE